MIRFIRRHCIGFLALFIALGGTAYAANTVRSIDIVDGQVKTVDLAKGAVTAAKTNGFRHGWGTQSTATSNCDNPGIWTSCGGTLGWTVPAGHEYTFVVTSEIHGDAGNVANPVHAQFCPATGGPTCIEGAGPEWVTFWPRGVSGESQTGIYNAGASDRSVSVQFTTAVKFNSTLIDDPGAHTTTTVRWYDSALNGAG